MPAVMEGEADEEELSNVYKGKEKEKAWGILRIGCEEAKRWFTGQRDNCCAI